MLSPEACHEAAHARISELVCFRVDHVSIVPTRCFGGLTRYTIDGEPSLRKRMRAQALVSLAGPAAESLHTGEPIREVLRRNPADCNRARAAVAILSGDASMEALKVPARRAQALVERHWASIVAIAEALQVSKTLHGADIARLVHFAGKKGSIQHEQLLLSR
jgi:hypothetical protein